MKKLILFLLLPLWAISQTSTTKEQEFDYGIKNNSTQTITTPPYLTTTGMDGTQGKIPSALIEKTDNKQNSLAVDGTGTKYPTVDAVNAALPKTYTTTVYVNTTSPNTATVFDDVNPPVTNDNALKSNTDNLYIGSDASPWVYNRSVYVTEIVPATSNFFIRGTTVDAGNSKTENIERIGGIKTSQTLDAANVNAGNIIANSIISNNETANTIASFDASKQIKSLPTITYPSLTELSYAKGVTSGIQSQINGKADLDGSGKVPLSQINDALLGSVNYKGTYNANTDTPVIPTATSSNKGWYYIISTGGTQQGFNFVNGDWIISNGTSWGKVDNNNTVTSVNGQVGAVNLTKSDVGLTNVDNTSDVNKPISTATQTALNLKQNTLTNPVTGTGTVNNIPKFTGIGTIGGSNINDTGSAITLGANATANGNLGIGTGFSSNDRLRIGGNFAFNASWNGILLQPIIMSSVTSDVNLVRTLPSMQSASFNLGTLSHFRAETGNIGIGASITLQNGFLVPSSFISATQNYAFRGEIPTGSNRWNLYMAGSAPNYLSGNTLFKTVVDNVIDAIQVNGTISASPATLSNQVVIKSQLDLKANILSPTFTGTPTAPTAAVGTSDNTIANAAFVQAANSDNVKLTGDQTKTGNLTLSGDSRLLSVVSADNETGYAILGIDALGLPYMQLGTSSNENTSVIRADNINTNSIYQLPNSSGTIALQETIKPYKVYTALLSQSGTDAPTATVLENTLGGAIVWTRSSTGVYIGTLSGAFTVNKTLFGIMGIGALTQNTAAMSAYVQTINGVRIDTTLTGTFTDAMMTSVPIEIRVYN